MSDSTIRVNRRESPFTQIDRKLINDRRLSLDTRFMLIWLLDKPPGWKTTIGSLVSQLPAGRSVVRRMIKESEELGYIQRIERRESGRFVYDYDVFDHPTKEDLTPPCAVSRRGSADAVQPTRFSRRGSAASVNRPLSNTVYSNTDQNNTELSDTDHHHQPPNQAPSIQADDDDDDSASSNPHFLLSMEIASTTNWNGYEKFLRGLSEIQLIASASWLYLYRDGSRTKQQNAYALDYSLNRKSLFDGVDNPVGKIITQARAGNIAPMDEDLRESFSAEIRAIFEGIKKTV